MNASDDLQVKQMIDKGRLAGPDIFVTAPFIEGPGSFAFQLKPILTADDARLFVRYWVSAGATSFKAYMNVSQEVLGAAIDEAHKLNTPVTGHLCSVTFREASTLGIDNLEHGLFVASDFALFLAFSILSFIDLQLFSTNPQGVAPMSPKPSYDELKLKATLPFNAKEI